MIDVGESPAGPPASDEVALAGADGAAAARLLRQSQATGSAFLSSLVRRALKAYDGKGPLLTKGDVKALADSLATVRASAELLGRSRTRERAERAGLSTFADEPLSIFRDELPSAISTPEAAVDYFMTLVPKLGIDPERFAGEQRRRAFTLAASANEVLTGKVRDRIAEGLRHNRSVADVTAEIQATLDEAGVGHRNPQYCFLPGTRVSGNVVAASKAPYAGPAVEIETDDGRRLRVTVNHPVLTTAGWLPAEAVHEGLQLVCHGRRVEPFFGGVAFPAKGRAVGDDQMPPRVEDVFESFAAESPARLHSKRPVCALDFHGDAACFHGDVHAVRADRELASGWYADSGKAGDQVSLVERNVASSCSACHRCGLLRSRHFGPSAAQLRRNLRDPGCPRVRRVGRPLKGTVFGATPDLHSGIAQATDKTPGGDPHLPADLLDRFPGKVSARRVGKVERIWWTGHVYDLQTETGFVVADGIVAGNCEMVYRTNAIDSFQTGMYEEGRHPDVRDMFPAWEYIGIHDHRAGEDHKPKFGKFYPSDATFSDVRGPRIFNCRCGMRWIDQYEWDDLAASGKRIQTKW